MKRKKTAIPKLPKINPEYWVFIANDEKLKKQFEDRGGKDAKKYLKQAVEWLKWKRKQDEEKNVEEDTGIGADYKKIRRKK